MRQSALLIINLLPQLFIPLLLILHIIWKCRKGEHGALQLIFFLALFVVVLWWGGFYRHFQGIYRKEFFHFALTREKIHQVLFLIFNLYLFIEFISEIYNIEQIKKEARLRASYFVFPVILITILLINGYFNPLIKALKL